jgi:hemolysin D
MKFGNGGIISLPSRKPTRTKEELAFLPAALEIVETPAPILVGAVSTILIALFCIALAWALVGHIDIVASATGKIVPNGRTKIIQPFEAGVVRAIHVTDGQAVKAGESLIELDPTIDDAERNHIESDLLTAQLDIARLTAALSADADPVASFHPPEGASPAQTSSQQQFLRHQVDEHLAKIAAIDQQIVQKRTERETIGATIQKLEAVIGVLQQRVEIRQTLYDRSVGSKANYLEVLQASVETKEELNVEKSRANEAEAALATLQQAKVQTDAEYYRTLAGELVEAQRKAAGFSEDLIKAQQRSKLQVLTAPVDGVVQQLTMHTVGGVVTPAQALLVIVPTESRLEIEAMVSNRDIGFIHVGQQAEIKVDTFNFTHYGLIHGRVLSLSQDAISRDKPQDKSSKADAGTVANSSEPSGQELVYSARIGMDRTQMQIDENLVNLTPGMAVTVEINTGSRSIMSYLLSPLMRYRQESLHER